MRRVADGRSLLADAVLAVDDFGLGRRQPQVDVVVSVTRAQNVVAPVEPRRPVFVADAVGVGGGARPADTGAVDALEGLELPPFNVRTREGRHAQIAHGPARRVLRLARYADAKEGQLVAEPPPVWRLQGARVIPPLNAIVFVRRVVARELVAVSRLSLAPPFFISRFNHRLLRCRL